MSGAGFRSLRGLARRGLFAGCSLAALVGGAGPAEAAAQVFEYAIEFPVLGTIGHYVNRIDRNGDAVTVTSTMRVLVEVAGVALYREDADRVERWRGDRLVQFDGVTTVNGEAAPVHGVAAGDRFVITSANGTRSAPGDLRPTNPWSPAFLRATTIFAVNTGTFEPSRISGGEPETVSAEGRQQAVRCYRAESRRVRARLCFAEDGVPVVMSIYAHGADIVLRLVRRGERA